MTRCRAVCSTRRGVARQCRHPAVPGSQYCRVPAHSRYSVSLAADLLDIMAWLQRVDPSHKDDNVKRALGIARKAFLRVTV
jgi:hypothetical protein